MSKKRNNQFNQQAQAQDEAVPQETEVTSSEETTAEEVVEVANEEAPAPAEETVAPVEVVEPPVAETPVVEAPAADSGILAQAPAFAARQAAEETPVVQGGQVESKDITLLKAYLGNYLVDINNPALASAVNGARVQLGFYRLIFGVLASKTEFKEKFEVLLAFMREHAGGVCSSRNIFRYFPSLPTDAKQANVFMQVVQFCCTLAAANTPDAAAKQIDIGRFLAGVNNDQITHNVTAYFR